MAIKKKSARQSSTRTAGKKVTPKKKMATKKAASKKTLSSSRARSRSSRSSGNMKPIDVLTERLDIMLPEVMFRIAAIEHLLVKNQLCSYEELVNARQFIQDQEGT